MYIQFKKNVNKKMRKSTIRRQQYFKLFYNSRNSYMSFDVHSMRTKFKFNTNFESISIKNFNDCAIFINRKKNVAIKFTLNVHSNFLYFFVIRYTRFSQTKRQIFVQFTLFIVHISTKNANSNLTSFLNTLSQIFFTISKFFKTRSALSQFTSNAHSKNIESPRDQIRRYAPTFSKN